MPPDSSITPPDATDVTGHVRTAWAAALGHRDFSDDDDFFAVGGHSLLVARIMAQLGQLVGSRLSLRFFFDHPTVHSLAEALAERAGLGLRNQEVNAP